MKRKLRRMSGEDIGVSIFSYGFMGLYAIIALVPFLNVLAKAFSSEWALVSGKVNIVPVDFQIDTMKYVVSADLFQLSIKNSLIVTLAGTALSILLTALAAYPLSKPKLPMRRGLMIIFVFTMLFNGGMIPTYLWMKQLNMVNTLRVLILPSAINVFNLLLVKNYYEGLPESLEESAKIDGANNATILFKIIMPLAMPVFATVCLFTAVGLWNDYFSAMIYNTKTVVKTLPLYLRDIITENVEDTQARSSDDMMNIIPEAVRSATIIASTLPILIVYPFLQKYFVKGVTIGSVKG